jgi:hypothetical protein
MQYSPKLKMAMEEIKAIIKKYDIGAIVELHTPGHGEFFIEVSPSYSCAWFEGNHLRIRARLKEDFNGDRKAWGVKVNDTTNMLLTFLDTNKKLQEGLTSALAMLEKKIEIEKDEGGGFTSHTQQNN